ncbi:MAG: hypothetical protein ACKE51_00670 [Methylococcaceae bacterium]
MIARIVKQSKHTFQYCFLSLIFSFLLASCTVVRTSFQSNESVVEYAELLFIRQNFVTQQLMMVDEDLTFVVEENVSQAELQMYDACHLLNEYARREMEGGKMSVFFRRRVKNSFKGCDEQVENMESLLIKIDQALEILGE